MARCAPAPLLVTLLIGVGCRAEATARPEAQARAVEASAAVEAKARPEAPSPGPGPVESRPYAPPSSLGPAIATRTATRSRTVYADRDHDAAVRGRIPARQPFFVFEERESPGCDRAWGLVAEAAWICLERTELSDEQPVALPILEGDAIVPFIYARHPGHDDLSTAPIPVFGSLSAYRASADPIDELPAYGSYAFTKLRPNRGDPILVTAGRDVVPLGELELFEPSEFAGRELERAPIPAGETLAWGIRWRAPIHPEPDPASSVVARVPFHTTLAVRGEGVLGPEGERWIEVLARPGAKGGAEGERAGGWIREQDIRRFLPLAPPEPILAGQITVDVDLDQQILSVWREDAPVFVTLVSSGKPNHATPTGLYRVQTKRAYGKMASLSDARDPYYADAVPWAMYFQGRYALHAAYWHDMFGHRQSHGCVNLSPRDAKRVFELAGPRLPDGWLLVHEHARDPGALVRVRAAGEATPDRRDDLAAADAASVRAPQ